MRLDWKSNLTISALHAAEAICSSAPVTDTRVRDALELTAVSLREWYHAQPNPSMTTVSLWNELINHAFCYDDALHLSAAVCSSIWPGNSLDATRQNYLAGRITELQSAYSWLFPQFSAQMDIRIRPLRELWEGFGNGIMAHLGRLTDRKLLASNSTVVAVQPILGGDGAAYPGNQFAMIEAVLTNPIPELPEVSRLAWLLAQQPNQAFSWPAAIAPERRQLVWALAMLPAVLAACQVVELARIDEANLALAINEWGIAFPSKLENPAPRLLLWWETYLQTKPSWDIALLAILKMLD